MGELKQVLTNAKTNKAPGYDQVPTEFYINAPDELLEVLLRIFNFILESGKVPNSFGRAIIFPLLKKGDTNKVENYRGISFEDTVLKLFTGIMLNRLVGWVNANKIIN